MGRETNLWKSTRPVLVKAGFFVQRIETSTAEGVPDVWVGNANGYAWLENKAVDGFPIQARTRVFGAHGLRKEQITWLLEATRCGLRAFVWAGVGVAHYRKSFLVPSREAERFNLMNRGQLEEYACSIEHLPSKLLLRGNV